MSRRDVKTSQGIKEIENSELLKIAEDILDGVKYSFANVASNEKVSVNANSIEADFQEALKTFNPKKLKNINNKAQELVELPKSARENLFGRYGALDASEFIKEGGFKNSMEILSKSRPLSINPKLLGLKIPRFSVPIVNLKPVNEGLLIPSINIAGDRWKELDTIKNERLRIISDNLEAGIVDETKMSEIWGNKIGLLDEEESDEIDGFEEQALYSKLALKIKRVKCVDETGYGYWGELGDDEIALAGVSVDEDGDTKKISEIRIGNSFDDGESKVYSPAMEYTWFNILEAGNVWPKKYAVTYLLAEKDNGGLSSVLHKVWEKIDEAVKKAIAEAVTAGLAAWKIPVEIAQVIGEVVAWVVDKLIKWIINAFKDDIFRPNMVTCRLGSRSGRFYHGGGRYRSYSRTHRSHFYGYDGHYYIEYYWKLS